VNTCEAEERCLKVAYEIELQWGSGRIDLGRIKEIATGRGEDKCTGRDTQATEELLGTSVKMDS